MNELLNVMERLLKEASLYLDLIKTNKRGIRISVELSDTGEVATHTPTEGKTNRIWAGQSRP